MNWAAIGAFVKENPLAVMLLLMILREAAPPVTRLVLAIKGKNGHHKEDSVAERSESGQNSGPILRAELEDFVRRDELNATVNALRWELGAMTTDVGDLARTVSVHREEQIRDTAKSDAKLDRALAGIETLARSTSDTGKLLAKQVFDGLQAAAVALDKRIDERLSKKNGDGA